MKDKNISPMKHIGHGRLLRHVDSDRDVIKGLLVKLGIRCFSTRTRISDMDKLAAAMVMNWHKSEYDSEGLSCECI